MRNFVYIVFLLIIFSCQSDGNNSGVMVNSMQNFNKEIKYAKGFTIEQFEQYKVITINNTWVGNNASFKYVLYKNEKPKGIEDAIFIKTPIESIACMSLTHVAFIEKLGKENSIIALSGCNYVSSIKIINRISNGLIFEIGSEQSINYELLVEKDPSLLMGFGIDASSNTRINKMTSLGIDVVLNAEYMETHPLGKAEWIKFIAAFYELDEEASLIFNKIESDYLKLLALTQKVKNKPTVFTGMPWSGSWYVPGAKSFQVQLFNDAGAQYLWMNNNEKASLVKSKEIIINEAYNADFWLNQNSYTTTSSILKYDEKFKGFKSVKDNQLYNNDKRLNATSGNDYWESGVINPQVVLKDLIKIFHPELLVEHELCYYRKLE